MAELCANNECMSCMACYNACPFGAIEIRTDELGVLIPFINADKCRECGKCTKTCPVFNPVSRNMAHDAIALYAKDGRDRKTCASGGVATTLSRKIIESEGCVYGVGFSSDGTPIYKRATSMNEIEEFKGSKYVYCNPGLIYRDVENQLKQKKHCLFIGTPCHVAGLRAYLKKDYDNLVCVDIICHGTPPYKYLKEHLDTQNIDIYTRFSFRGELDYKLAVFDDRDNLVYKSDITEDAYFLAFSNSTIVRSVCLSCPYSITERVSDITIGDFWGIKKPALDGYSGKISVALMNTEKGNMFFETCKDMFVYEVRNVLEAINGNPKLKKSTGELPEQKRFIKEYLKTNSVEKAFNNIGITRKVKINRIKNIVFRIPRKILMEIRK